MRFHVQEGVFFSRIVLLSSSSCERIAHASVCCFGVDDLSFDNVFVPVKLALQYVMDELHDFNVAATNTWHH